MKTSTRSIVFRKDAMALTLSNYTVILPGLTTVFTPPTDCHHGAWTSNASAYGTLVCTKEFSTSCFPGLFAEDAMFSPGVCPDSYNPGTQFSDSAFPNTTSCVCCPGNKTFNPVATNCQGAVTQPTDVIVSNRITRYTQPFNAVAQLVLVAWESSDLSSFTPVSAPLLRPIATTALETASSSISSTTPTDDSHATLIAAPASNPFSNGLSRNARLGLGIGIACDVLLLLCALAGLVHYHRRLQKLRAGGGTEKLEEVPHVSGVDAKAELSGESHVHEIDSHEAYPEADDSNIRHELEGDWHGVEVRGK